MQNVTDLCSVSNSLIWAHPTARFGRGGVCGDRPGKWGRWALTHAIADDIVAWISLFGAKAHGFGC